MLTIVDFSTLAPSDLMLLLNFTLATFLAAYFAFGYPRTWVRDRLGWVIFGYAVVTVAFIGLIAYAIVFGQKAAEPIRFAIGLGMAAALVAKTWAVYRERREGRLARLAVTHERPVLMSEPKSSIEAVKDAAAIWYKAQRVLRTAFTTLLTVLPLVPQIIAIIQGQWSAEWLTGVAVQAVAINAALTAIIALPTVNAWLTKIGLGSVPKSALVMRPDENGTYVYVRRDERATRG